MSLALPRRGRERQRPSHRPPDWGPVPLVEREVGARPVGALRALFVNENLGGHTAMHTYLRVALADHPEIDATFMDVPPPGLCRRMVAVPVPGLARLDADLQALRYQLAQSAYVRRRLHRLLADVDVVHVYTHNAVLLSAAALASRPTVVSLDTTNLVNAFSLDYRRPGRMTGAGLRAVMPLERRVYEAARVVVAQSEWTAVQLEHYGVSRHRVRVIPFGVTVPAVAPRAATEGLPRVTFVGKTMAGKGGWALVRAFESGLRAHCRLTLVTRDRVGARPGIEVLNDVRPGDGRLLELFARTAVFVLPTVNDKAPYAVLEAMAAGVPVVSTRVGAIPEMVQDGVSGILVDAGDQAGLVAALRALLGDEDRRQAMGDAARRRVLERFDARRTTADLVDLLAGVYGGREPS
ncbi:MAG: glycosyltransferase family 4 protein [Actinobacteria bacterium]|nr:glycosyltransferase family 4 protein [Actinomycetota bacterium]